MHPKINNNTFRPYVIGALMVACVLTIIIYGLYNGGQQTKQNTIDTVNKSLYSSHVKINGKPSEIEEAYLFDDKAHPITTNLPQEESIDSGDIESNISKTQNMFLRLHTIKVSQTEKPVFADNSNPLTYEALQSYYNTQITVLLIIVISLLSALFFIYIIRIKRRKNRTDIAESEEYLRIVLENAADGIITINSEGTIQTFNFAAENLFQYQASEVLNCNVDILVPPPYKKQHSFFIQNYSTTGESKLVGRKSNLDGQKKDGTIFPISISLSEIKLDSGNIYVAIVRDLTSEKQISEKLKHYQEELELLVEERTSALIESEALNRQILESAGEGICGVNNAGETIFINPTASMMLGYSPEDLLGEQLHSSIQHSFADGTFYPIEKSPIYATYTRGEGYHSNYDIMWRKDGQSFPVEYTSKPIYNHEQVIGAVITFSDITKRLGEEKELKKLNAELEYRVSERTAELQQYSDKLRRSQYTLKRAQQMAHLGSWNWDITSGDLYWTDEIYHIFGLEPQQFEATYEAFLEFIHPDDRDKVVEAVNASVADAKIPYNIEHRIVRPNGDIRHVHEQGEIERDESGAPLYMVGIVQDLTERIIAQQELVAARESAELANRAKSEFLALMSHEIRTPMNAIIGMSNLVMNTDLTPRQSSYLKKVIISAESLLHIINDILDFSKIEAGQMHLECIDFKLDDILDKLTHLVVLKAQEKGLEFLFSVSPKVPDRLRGDPTRILQVLVNLASNAVKFTTQGEIVLSIELIDISENLATVKFNMRDTGIGIEQENQQRLFKSFSQADNSITRKYGGTGLGLVIVKRLIELMKGEVGFSSEYGKGSTFYFTVPFELCRNSTSAGYSLPDDIANLRVLVVDDSSSARTILSETLESFGFEVDVVSTSTEAIAAYDAAKLKQRPYRLILMDWKMPGLSGVDGARAILAHSGTPVPPVIMMVTAYNEEDLIDEIRDLAISSTLVKPVSPSSLLDAILDAFKKSQPRQSAAITDTVRSDDPADKLAGTHVLLVEDNDLNRELVTELLHEAGIHTSCASNGQEALDLLQSTRFDGILMDVRMPVMDGLEATRIIRRKKRWKSLPIIALTADALDQDRNNISDAGMDDIIIKPINAASMLETMSRWIMPPLDYDTPFPSAIEHTNSEIDLSIPGLDINSGLRTCNSRLTLYKKILQKFIQEENFVTQFKIALKDKDYETAERLAHTLKGTAGNIGAFELQEAARELQNSIKERSKNSIIRKLFSRIESEITRLIDSINKSGFLSDVDVCTQTNNLSPSDLMSTLRELENLLVDDDTDATEIMNKIHPILENTDFSSAINKINRLTNRYEFKDALRHLRKLIDKINQDHPK